MRATAIEIQTKCLPSTNHTRFHSRYKDVIRQTERFVLHSALLGACHAYRGMFLYTHECVILMHEATRSSKTPNRMYVKSVPKIFTTAGY